MSEPIFVKARIWKRYRRCVLLRKNANGTVDLRVMGGDLVAGMPGIHRQVRPEEIRKADRHLVWSEEERDGQERARTPEALTERISTLANKGLVDWYLAKRLVELEDWDEIEKLLRKHEGK